MKIIKALSILAISFFLAACSGAPSDSDVRTVTSQSEKEMDQQLAPLGLKWSDVFETEVKVKNKAKQDDGRWLVQTQTTAVAKKDWPGGKKGEPMPGTPASDQMYMQKGDNGWIASR